MECLKCLLGTLPFYINIARLLPCNEVCIFKYDIFCVPNDHSQLIPSQDKQKTNQNRFSSATETLT